MELYGLKPFADLFVHRSHQAYSTVLYNYYLTSYSTIMTVIHDSQVFS